MTIVDFFFNSANETVLELNLTKRLFGKQAKLKSKFMFEY